MKKKLNYKQMLVEILPLAENDFVYDMELKLIPDSKPYTQKEAKEMAKLLASVYSIAHCLHCTACGKKYLIK